MKPTSEKWGQGRQNIAVTRAVIEIVAAIAASVIMALMVVGGGIAVDRLSNTQTMSTDDTKLLPEPAPLSWRETT